MPQLFLHLTVFPRRVENTPRSRNLRLRFGIGKASNVKINLPVKPTPCDDRCQLREVIASSGRECWISAFKSFSDSGTVRNSQFRRGAGNPWECLVWPLTVFVRLQSWACFWRTDLDMHEYCAGRNIPKTNHGLMELRNEHEWHDIRQQGADESRDE